MARSSQHFNASEFACPHCGATFVRPALLARLERLRAKVGRPLRIVSGYRCPPHNAAIGGASDSQHVYAAAADIPAGYCSPSLAAQCGFVGIGSRHGWAVHVDVRDGPAARWTYPDAH
jgi:zinc D-Ala-D-Ala carboxypeptidase